MLLVFLWSILSISPNCEDTWPHIIRQNNTIFLNLLSYASSNSQLHLMNAVIRYKNIHFVKSLHEMFETCTTVYFYINVRSVSWSLLWRTWVMVCLIMLYMISWSPWISGAYQHRYHVIGRNIRCLHVGPEETSRWRTAVVQDRSSQSVRWKWTLKRILHEKVSPQDRTWFHHPGWFQTIPKTGRGLHRSCSSDWGTHPYLGKAMPTNGKLI